MVYGSVLGMVCIMILWLGLTSLLLASRKPELPPTLPWSRETQKYQDQVFEALNGMQTRSVSPYYVIIFATYLIFNWWWLIS